ncbi:MAG: hypothetical protein PIR53_17830 [Nocardioides alkalitolerans]
MADISRRGIVRAGVWSVPAIAVVAAAPAVAASAAPAIRITSIVPRGFSDWITLSFAVDGIPVGASGFVQLSWTPAGGTTIDTDYALVSGPGTGSITLSGFTRGTTYTFTVSCQVGSSPVVTASSPYTP